jgi:hypothetical protein
MTMLPSSSEPKHVKTIRADKFDAWRMLGDYKLIDDLIAQYPEGFDMTVSRQGVYHFRPNDSDYDPDIVSFGIYVYGDRVYRVTSSLFGRQRKPRKRKGQPVLGTGEETSKTLPPASD